jgi:hypothetical protein
MTSDNGVSWEVVHEYVKAFFWTNTKPKSLLIERTGPGGQNNVIDLGPSRIRWRWGPRRYTEVISNVEDFQIRGDYMFATKKVYNNKVLLFKCLLTIFK